MLLVGRLGAHDRVIGRVVVVAPQELVRDLLDADLIHVVVGGAVPPVAAHRGHATFLHKGRLRRDSGGTS